VLFYSSSSSSSSERESNQRALILEHDNNNNTTLSMPLSHTPKNCIFLKSPATTKEQKDTFHTKRKGFEKESRGLFFAEERRETRVLNFFFSDTQQSKHTAQREKKGGEERDAKRMIFRFFLHGALEKRRDIFHPHHSHHSRFHHYHHFPCCTL
tara:strand:- start:233 stop:694 length:462 start_codon:yes stop_codon:yes gene_type:complete